MKAKLVGLIVVIGVVGAAIGYKTISDQNRSSELTGYVGGEKIGFLEDEDVEKILQKKYHLTLDYAKAGSLDMVTADKEGKDYLWPSSQTALEFYKQEVGKPVRSDTIFNTPIVIYTRKAVADALTEQGIVSESGGAAASDASGADTGSGGVYTVDLGKLIGLVEDGTSWSSIGLPQLYGNVTVSSTDPTKSNSGNMFAGLLANTLAGGVATESNIDEYLPEIKLIFEKSGYMESSSADIFSEFLRMGMGAKPLVVGYENQLLEFASQQPSKWDKVKDDVIMLYPVPTVWSSHVLIAMDDQASDAIDALEDEEVQKLAWEKHGFRTGVSGDAADMSAFGGIGIEETVTQVGQMPNYKTMKKIIDYLEG